jgi:hypothetical protein
MDEFNRLHEVEELMFSVRQPRSPPRCEKMEGIRELAGKSALLRLKES